HADDGYAAGDRVLRDSLTGVGVTRISGILNGTCNFLLSEMLSSGRDYDQVLAEAQALGYAEADPTLDVSGADAAQKAAILAAIGFSADLDYSKVRVRGVEEVGLIDLRLADRLGFRIKLIAESKVTSEGVVCRVAPTALPIGHPLAGVDGSLNMVRVEGDPVGAIVMSGPGAGAGPTASAVMGDISLLFAADAGTPFGGAGHHERRSFVAPNDNEKASWFLRVRLLDQPGALAKLSEALAAEDVSIDKLLQDSADDQGASPVAIVTHPCARANMDRATARLKSLEASIDEARLIRIDTGV
ncbi:MAG: homoserine dehydrogenase, partial [Pseudomonadota bacterium]